MSQKENFQNWMIQQGLREPTAASYSHAILLISQHYTKETGTSTDIYSITNQDEINQLVRDYSQQGKFSKFGYEQHGRFRAAIKKYAEFFAGNSHMPRPHMPQPPRPRPPRPRHSPQEPCIYRNKISEHEKDICSILARIAYHVHPKITRLIVEKKSTRI